MPVGTHGLDLCRQHADRLAESVLSDLARDAFSDGGYGPRVLHAMAEYARGHRRQPAPAFWAWIYAMEDMRLAREPQEPEPPKWVYFAEREGFVKIGMSRNVERRLAELAAGAQLPDGMTAGPLRLLATVPGGAAVEHAYHARFGHLRIDPRREWFLLDGDLAAFVAEIAT